MAERQPVIGVFGTLNWDTTEYADGTRSENLGGLVYTLATLGALSAGALRVLPVANVGFDLIERVRASPVLHGVDLAALQRVEVPNNHVHLRYRDAEHREEVLVGLVPPIDIAQCAAAANAELVLVNLTSGRDIELATLQEFRRRYAGCLYLDVHSLTLDIAAGGRRVLHWPARWQEWAAAADWVQVNETEARLLGGGCAYESFASTVLELGARGVIVTLGGAGCFASWSEAGERYTLRLAPALQPAPVYPTGCGDVFGATLAYALVRRLPVAKAVALATEVASLKAAREPLAALAALRDWAAAPLRHAFPADV